MSKPRPSQRVLVLDADMVPALTVARALRRIGLTVDVASHVPHPIAGYSRAVDRVMRYPDPTRQDDDFIAWLAARHGESAYTLIIPATERTVVPLARHRAQLSSCPIAMAADTALEAALDKSKTLALAEKLHIPVPRSVALDNIDQLDTAAQALAFPIVVKPARSMGSHQNELVQLGVSYAFDAAELRAQVTHALRYGQVLLQEYVRGEGTGIELIADRGKIIYAFQHLRLHEVPLTGGGSSLRQSVAVDPTLLDAAAKLMQALAWHGVAMVEFKRNAESGDYRLMEINGRFWGSLPLAVAAGADFPAMLYELLVQGHVTPRPQAALNIYGRKLGSDLYWTELVLRRDAPARLVTLPTTRAVIRDWLRVFSPRHHFDIQQWRDPVPGLVDIARIVQTYTARLRGIVRDHYLARRLRAAWRGGRVARELRRARRVLFLCYGNINRSPLAERSFRMTSAGMRIACDSAGFHDEEGRPADPGIVAAAGAIGIDMNGWRSRRVNRELVDSADIIFVMEYQHYRRLAESFPEARDRIFLLSPDGEIDDPYGKSPEAYEKCTRDITSHIRHLDALLSR